MKRFRLVYTTEYHVHDDAVYVNTSPALKEHATFLKELQECISSGNMLEGAVITMGTVTVEEIE